MCVGDVSRKLNLVDNYLALQRGAIYFILPEVPTMTTCSGDIYERGPVVVVLPAAVTGVRARLFKNIILNCLNGAFVIVIIVDGAGHTPSS